MSRDITQLHPRLQAIIPKLIEECKKNGVPIKIGECVRTVAEQNTLYAQGRTAPGCIVTYAKGTDYQSQHQWGIACDFYLDMDVDGDGSKTDDAFNNADRGFEKVGAIAKKFGLGWGGDWSSPIDRPHLYLPDWGATTTALKKAYGTPAKFKATWNKSTTSVVSKLTTATTKTTTTVEKGSGYMFEPKIVKEGSKGTSVLLLQEILKARGFKGANGKDLALDREAGTNTIHAINAYQTARRKQGVELGTNKKNDGICGTKMWKDLIAI